MEKIWIQDLGSGIWDPEETSQSSKTGNLLAKFARTFKNRIMIKPFVETAFWDETKSFLQSKAASVVFGTDPDWGKTKLIIITILLIIITTTSILNLRLKQLCQKYWHILKCINKY
jgi:hypothetical protein